MKLIVVSVRTRLCEPAKKIIKHIHTKSEFDMPKANCFDKFGGDRRGWLVELCNCRKLNGRAQQQQSSRQKRERGETYVATLERRIASVYIAGRRNGVHIYVMMESTDACETKEHMQNELVFKRRIAWFYFCLIVCDRGCPPSTNTFWDAISLEEFSFVLR